MMTTLQFAEGIRRYIGDELGGAQWVAANFDEFSEKDRNNLLEAMLGRWDEFPDKAKAVLWKVFAEYAAGRKFIFELMRDKMVRQMVLMLQAHVSPEVMREFLSTCLKQAIELHRDI